jgi:hypothetical protein
VLAPVVEEQRLGAALALILAGAHTDRVDAAPIALGLRVNFRIAVDFGGRGLKDFRVHALGEAQYVDRTVDARLRRLHRVELIVDGRGRAGEVVDLVYLDIEREGDVMAHQFETRLLQEVGDVVLPAGEKIIDTQNILALRDEPLAQVRAEESGAARHQDPLRR